MSDFLDFKKIPLGFQRTNSINDALESFYQHSATDKNFKHLDHVYWIRPHSKIRASCCNKLVELHPRLTRAILWQYKDFSLCKHAFLKLFKSYPDLGCGCDIYISCLLEDDLTNLRKYYQVQNINFYENDSEGIPFEYSGLVEYSKHFGETTLLVDDFEVNIFTFKEGKLDGPYIRYMLFIIGDWLQDIWDFVYEKNHSSLLEKLDAAKDSIEELKAWKKILVEYLKLSKLPFRGDRLLDIRTALYEALLQSLLQRTIKAFLDQDSISDYEVFIENKEHTFVAEQGFFKNNMLDGELRTFNDSKGMSNEIILKQYVNDRETRSECEKSLIF